VHPHLIALGKGVFWIAKGCVAGVRTLRYGQEAIRHKRTTSRAARGPFHLFRLHLDLRSDVLKKVTVTFPQEKCGCTFEQRLLGSLFM
jgi:hypothetical protein